MARQFREQLEEEVQLEQARKAHQTAPPPPPEPAPVGAAPPATPAPDFNTSPQQPEPAASATPPAAPTGDGATGAESSVTRPAHAGGADERRT
jgi:hypothetical protein